MKIDRHSPLIPTSSMADIAFLLLIFFLVTTTIASDQGLPMVLPPERDQYIPVEIRERNVLKILINSSDNVQVEGETIETLHGLETRVVEFILNPTDDPSLSESPQKAVVSLRTDRNTSHRRFIAVLDKIHEGYNRMYAERVGLDLQEWLDILNDLNNPDHREVFDRARGKQPDGRVLYPMQISIAEPVSVPLATP